MSQHYLQNETDYSLKNNVHPKKKLLRKAITIAKITPMGLLNAFLWIRKDFFRSQIILEPEKNSDLVMGH